MFTSTPASRLPRLVGVLRRAQQHGYPRRLGGEPLVSATERVGHALEGQVRFPSDAFHGCVGQYLVQRGDVHQRVCIDSTDYGTVASVELEAWSDIYFKTNLWESMEYGPKVRPLVNGDPAILDLLPALRAARATPKTHDLAFVVRVWGGRQNAEGIEHNLALLKAINRVKCKKHIIAVLVAGDIERDGRYLRSMGVEFTTKGIPRAELWRMSHCSRLNIIRLGMHYCIPWRMVGALASGSCVILDRAPFSRWPEPLRHGTNFLDLGIPVGPDVPLGPDAAYGEIEGRIDEWLSQPAQDEAIAARNADYFDRSAALGRVGAHILSVLGG